MENFGAVLKDIRISKNFRLKDLACYKISESTISRFENGITKLSIDHFYILLNRLGISFSEFEELVHCYYSKKECFFKIEDKSNLITIGFNIIPYTGALQFVWSVKQNKQMLELSWGVWESILEEMLNKSFEIRPRPYYSNYQELEEILTEAFAIYEDFKTEVLKVDWEKESDL